MVIASIAVIFLSLIVFANSLNMIVPTRDKRGMLLNNPDRATRLADLRRSQGRKMAP
jgi:hypothetical protein